MRGLLSPTQSGLGLLNPYQYHPAYRMHYPLEGVVVRVHFPEDSSNRSKREVEYDIKPTLLTLGVLTNVPLATGVHGIVDAEEVLLKPARLVIPTGEYTASRSDPSQTDGDRVLVQFINGSFLNPVITNVLTHHYQGRTGDDQAAKYKDKSEILIPSRSTGYEFGDGSTGKTAADMVPTPDIKRLKHARLNGTNFAVDTKGSVFLNLKKHPETDSANKKVVVQTEGKDLLRLEKTASNFVAALLEGVAGNDIKFQIGDGTWIELTRVGSDLSFKVGSDPALLLTKVGTTVNFKVGHVSTNDITVQFGDDPTFLLTRSGSDITFRIGEAASPAMLLTRTSGVWAFKIGDGAHKVAIADHLKTLYNTLDSNIDSAATSIGTAASSLATAGTQLNTAGTDTTLIGLASAAASALVAAASAVTAAGSALSAASSAMPAPDWTADIESTTTTVPE
jgi:hypothetical protein